MDEDGQSWASSKYVKIATAVTLIVAAIAIVGTFAGMFYTVTEQQRTVITRFSKMVDVAGPGLGVKWPWIQSAIPYRVDVQQLNLQQLNTYTIDSQEIDANIGIQFRIPPSEVGWVFTNAQDYRDRLKEIAIDRFKQVMGNVQATDFAKSRAEAVKKSFTLIRDDVKALLHVDVTDFQILDANFTKKFRDDIERAASAKANIEKVTQDKIAAAIEAEKNKIIGIGIADKAREEARGEADGIKLLAEASAEKIRMEGDAQAKAILGQVQALKTANSDFVALEVARKWNGELPTHQLSGPGTLLTLPAAR